MELARLKDGIKQENITTTDVTRSNCHDAFMDATNSANRLCKTHSIPLIYASEKHRYHYGAFAGQLVDAIFENRQAHQCRSSH